MLNFVAIQQEIVRDDTTVATPPHRFRTHQRQTALGSRFDQLCKGGGEFIPQRIIGIVVEALYTPAGIQVRVDASLLRATAAKGWGMEIADLQFLEARRQGVDIEDRVGARAWERAHVDQKLN